MVSLSPKEYAQRHGVSTKTVHRWIKARKLNVIRFSARTIRIVPRSLKIGTQEDMPASDR